MQKQTLVFVKKIVALDQSLFIPVLVVGILILAYGQFNLPFDSYLGLDGKEYIAAPDWIAWTEEITLADFKGFVVSLVTGAYIGIYYGILERTKTKEIPLLLLLMIMICMIASIKVGVIALFIVLAVMFSLYFLISLMD
ncbi:MAG: hypothetical protein RLZZ230_313 [Candidatus Parcubacteria bacterium]|jgi:hypothetical protein